MGAVIAMTPIRLRIAELRAAKGWTQEQLAEAAGISRLTVIRIEGAKNKRIDYDVLEKLADALGVDEPGYLIVRDPPRQAGAAKRRGRV